MLCLTHAIVIVVQVRRFHGTYVIVSVWEDLVAPPNVMVHAYEPSTSFTYELPYSFGDFDIVIRREVRQPCLSVTVADLLRRCGRHYQPWRSFQQ